MPATDLPAAAASLSASIASFAPEKVAALLHEAAFVSSSRRYWDAFLGARNTIVTTWVRAGVYEVDFFGSEVLRDVGPVMPAMG